MNSAKRTVTRRECLGAVAALAVVASGRVRADPPVTDLGAGTALDRVRALQAQFDVGTPQTPNSGGTLLERMAKYRVPGASIAIISGGRIVWARGYGVREAGGSSYVTPDTRFQAASVSKPIAALATLRLVESGALELDRDVNTYLKTWTLPRSQFTEKKRVTLRRIMSHTAGLSVHGFDGYAAGELLPTVRQILDGMPPANSAPVRSIEVPGVKTEYSGGGITVQQLIVMDLTGRSYADLLAESVLRPLGMSNSTYSQPPPESMGTAAASAHDADGKPLSGRWHIYPEQAAAGLWTTPSDVAKYILGVQAAVAGRAGAIIGRNLAREMVTPQLENDQDTRYGLGPGLNGLKFGHGGSNEGFRCQFTGLVDGDSGAVVMTNGAQGSELIKEILPMISKALTWRD